MLRRGEVFNLKWPDANFQTKTLTVQGETAKSGENRHIPLNAEALDVLKQWKKQCSDAAQVFHGRQRERLDNIAWCSNWACKVRCSMFSIWSRSLTTSWNLPGCTWDRETNCGRKSKSSREVVNLPHACPRVFRGRARRRRHAREIQARKR